MNSQRRKIRVTGTNIEVPQLNCPPTLSDEEALQNSLRLEQAYNKGLKNDDPVVYDFATPVSYEEDGSVSYGPVPEREGFRFMYYPGRKYVTKEEEAERYARMEKWLGKYSKEIRSCNFHVSEEEDYVLRFMQITEKLVIDKLDICLELNLQHRATDEYVRLAGKVAEKEKEAQDYPSRVTKIFRLQQTKRREAFEKEFPGWPTTKEALKDLLRTSIDERMTGYIEEIVGPVVKSAKERDGKTRTEREKWNQIHDMVLRAVPLLRKLDPNVEGIWWDHVLGGIPDWYKPIWYKHGSWFKL